MTQAAEFTAYYCGDGRAATPPHFGTRFDAAGTFLPEPGNTVVCHVVPGSATERALVSIRDRLKALDADGHFAFTPVSSYHMTVFQGVIEYRRTWPFWPRELPQDAAISDTTRHFADRLKDFVPVGPRSVKLDRVTPLGLVVSGATDADEKVLRTFRDRLAERFGYRHPDHDRYVFHVTLAYLVRWLPADAHERYLPALAEMTRDLAAAAPVIELGPADFCSFEDMNHFQPLLRLD